MERAPQKSLASDSLELAAMRRVDILPGVEPRSFLAPGNFFDFFMDAALLKIAERSSEAGGANQRTETNVWL